MVKVKHPLVKLLRKAGYSCQEAMVITQQAIDNTKEQSSSWCYGALRKADDKLCLSGTFSWSNTPQGSPYWNNICRRSRLVQ